MCRRRGGASPAVVNRADDVRRSDVDRCDHLVGSDAVVEVDDDHDDVRGAAAGSARPDLSDLAAAPDADVPDRRRLTVKISAGLVFVLGCCRQQRS